MSVAAKECPKILIVDDTPTYVEFLEGVLRAEGLRTVSASDGVSARAPGRTKRPNLILLDA